MACRRLLALGALLLSGCLYHATEHTDEVVCALTAHPFDVAPTDALETAPAKPPDKTGSVILAPSTDVQTAALMAADQPAPPNRLPPPKVPPEVPGEETPLLPNIKALPKEQQIAALRKIYGPLPQLPDEPKALPGPDGQPYTLTQLQRIAAGNSPTLKQAASDVQAAQGALEAAWAYPNPTVSYQATPSSDGTTPTTQGFVIDQTIRPGGKQKLGAAAAQKALENAQLALKRARSDLATQVRQAYFALLVAKEAVRVTKAMAHFTESIYLFQEDQAEAGQAANYDPAIFRGWAWQAQVAYLQAVQNYQAAWMQLAAAICVRQLPLTEVAGRIDAFIPYFDSDQVLARVLQNHTDVQIARNGVEAAKYNLKLAQITPWAPDVDFQIGVFHDFAVPPQGTTVTSQVGVPIPIWDQNKGPIRSAEAALVRAKEEQHRVEMVWRSTLATNYANYKNNLIALEYYRKHILPDQIIAYRGVDERRRIEINALSLVDLSTAQQNLAVSVTTYLGVLSSLWSSVVSVADPLQTDDLFQLAEQRDLPPLPDLEHLPPLPCNHPCAAAPGPVFLERPDSCPPPALPPVLQTKATTLPTAAASSTPTAPAGPVGDSPAAPAAGKPAAQKQPEPLRYPPPPAPGSAAAPPPAPGVFRNPWQSTPPPQP
ncbi:MAG TPA: TolC family protein [Gemmataceae bacterium]|nr:TolC family protein [Gemmataceae bacterium]